MDITHIKIITGNPLGIDQYALNIAKYTNNYKV